MLAGPAEMLLLNGAAELLEKLFTGVLISAIFCDVPYCSRTDNWHLKQVVSSLQTF